MDQVTNVVLLTGFLGSGKTTLLNRLMAAVPKDLKVLILMNEFGEIGIDGALVTDEDADILEVSRGSIFCICVKTDFIKSLHRIANDVRPDLLLIEATGVANPQDIKQDLALPIFGNRFRFLEQVCVIDVESFETAYQVYASVEKQLASSTLFILNKVDLVHPDTVARIREMIRAHNPNPVFLEAVRCDVPLGRIVGRLAPSARASQAREPSGQGESAPLAPQELSAVMNQIQLDPFREITPPDWLMSTSFAWRGENLEDFRQLVQELPRGIVRGKGFLRDGEEVYLVSLVMGRTEYQVMDSRVPENLVGKLVLIHPPELEQPLAAVAASWAPKFAVLPPDPAGCS